MTTDARDARSLPEEGFHEIHLSGKQLVFLFMATTVVSVVIFLCGVLVGRGVRTDAAEAARPAAVPAAETAAAPPDQPPAETPAEPVAAGQTPPPAEQTAAAAGGYYEQLMAAQPPAETLSPPADAKPAPETRPAEPAADVKKAEAPRAAADEGGYLIQVTALRQRDEAAAVADRLTRRGYKAFVLEPQPGSTPLYRVRVGPFADRAEADRVMKRLAREEQVTPFLAR